ncbi:MAG: hypothetical protein JWR26_4407 [Pedosphaera sp.]|nr:hypothetical protein [Pedosphaera sp.]
MHYWRMALAILLQPLAYFIVAWEWQLLLRPSGHLPLVKAMQAVFAGRFTNDVMPFQTGYLVRAYLASRWMGSGFGAVVPSLVVERLWEGVWLVSGIGALAVVVPLPDYLLLARNILAFVMLAGIGLVLLMILRRRLGLVRRIHKTFSRWKPGRNALCIIDRVVDGVRRIGTSRLLPAILGLSILKLAIQALAFLALMWAYGLKLSVWSGLAVFLIAYLGICIPSTPASAGVFQLFSITGLSAFGISKEEATGFSLVAFVAWTLPMAIIGFFALAQSGMTLRKIQNAEFESEAERPGDSSIGFSSATPMSKDESCGV